MLKSGVNATLAGIVAVFFMPLKAKDGEGSMLNLQASSLGCLDFAFLRLNLSSQSYQNTAIWLSFTDFVCLLVSALR